MLTAIFQDRLGYLAGCVLAALALGGAAWWAARRLGNPRGPWWAGLTATVTGVLGLTFMGSGPAMGSCVVNHDVLEPFGTTQGVWNLAMTVPLGFFALGAVRRPLPVLVGVVALPPAIEFVQGSVDGLGRICDSSDALMNVLGGLAGVALAALFLVRAPDFAARGGARGAGVAAAVLLVAGMVLGKTAIAFTHLDGTGLSPADPAQRRAAEAAVREAFGDAYGVRNVYHQPCVDLPCAHVSFAVVSPDMHPDEIGGMGSLSWPDGRRLTVEPGTAGFTGPGSVPGFPVPGAGAAPKTEAEAEETARRYMRAHYPWARSAADTTTYPYGPGAARGWVTAWRWVDGGIVMPRTLNVHVDRTGRVARVVVALGPTRLDLPDPERSADEAAGAVRRHLEASAGDRELPPEFRAEAYTLQAVERGGVWRAEWLVTARYDETPPELDPHVSEEADRWWVDAVTGRIHHDGFGTTPVAQEYGGDR
ncbi:VanZ family protein [Streptomyces sp. NPDC085479]|uniref:VanZ family protein n=1 Tax=Streptomyces sp. NPDC085479 TaxID=3365726 RepID=UPI0037D46E90